MQCACAILLSVACPFLSYFPHYPARFAGGGGVIEHKMCVSISSVNFVYDISHYKKNSARYRVTQKNGNF
jgi:hypothetical protein